MDVDELERLRHNVLMACDGLTDPDSRVRDMSHLKYEDLIKEFEAAFKSYLSPQQIKMARRVPDYFLNLIDLASWCWVKY